MKCRVCKNEVVIFLRLGLSPLADAFAISPDQGTMLFPLRVAYCNQCWLIQLTNDVEDTMLYGQDYAFFSGSSPVLVDYFKDYAQWVKQRFPTELEQGVLEIACNDGTLLRHFDNGMGIDPAVGPTELARRNGLNVVTAPFSVETAEEKKFGVVIANNVIAHVRDPRNFIENVEQVLAPNGVVILEFQYLSDLIDAGDFPLFYHEHRSYFSLTSLMSLLEGSGLFVNDVVRTPMQGGSLRVVLSRTLKPALQATELWQDEAWLRQEQTYRDFSYHVAKLRRQIHEMVSRYAPVTLYGASAKATTLIFACDLINFIDYALDLTPYKIGKYLPGTDIAVINPVDESCFSEFRIPIYLLGVYNYTDAVIAKEKEYLNHGGKIIVPLPEPHTIEA